jgi:hypothetical protein
MVGSRNYFATSSLPLGCTPSVNCKIRPRISTRATQGLRQPGSSLKPFIYLTGFQIGYSPETILFDVPTEFSTYTSCPTIPNFNGTYKNCFHPQNFEGTFVGALFPSATPSPNQSTCPPLKCCISMANNAPFKMHSTLVSNVN